MLRVDTERRFLLRFKNLGLAPSNVSNCGKSDREVKLLALKGGLPGKVVLHIVPLDPTLKGGTCGARSGQDRSVRSDFFQEFFSVS